MDLMEVTVPDLEISMGGFAWHGYRGLEDHQTGSKDRFFDQHFGPRGISVEPPGGEATVGPGVRWNARHRTFPAAKSQGTKAICTRTRKARGPPDTGKPVAVLDHVDHTSCVEGFEPPEAKRGVDPRVGREIRRG